MQMTATGAKNRFSHRCAKGRSAPMFVAKGGLLKFVMRNLLRQTRDITLTQDAIFSGLRA